MFLRLAMLAFVYAPFIALADETVGQNSFSLAHDGFFAAVAPGAARAALAGETFSLENDLLKCEWSVRGGALKPVRLRDQASKATVDISAGEAFRLILEGGKEIAASQMKMIAAPEISDLKPSSAPIRFEERLAGKAIRLRFKDAETGIEAEWSAILREGSNYVTQEITVRAAGNAVALSELALVDLPLPGARVLGAVDGSPVFAGQWFAALEHPMSKIQVKDGRARCALQRSAPLKAGEQITARGVIGLTIAGQTRRGFLYYLERSRAHPYRQFLHYNSWYDIAWPGHLMNEAKCLAVIEGFGEKLIRKRGVAMKSFVFDDGWDDHNSLWGFNSGFPNGFTPLQAATKCFSAGVGVWVSPWGGYGNEQKQRLAYGRSQGFETNPSGFSLGGPNYNRRFTEVCRNFIEKYGCNYFKFDGIGGGAYASGAPRDKTGDLEALLALCARLRGANPDLFINATVGTWPSPFWLWSVDSIWRQGQDISFAGAGSMRDKWITYRDGTVYKQIVRRGPMYPLNSLMVHGMALAQLGTPTRMNNDVEAFRRDTRDFFATGTDLQELYISHNLLTDAHWDVLAETALWARKNEAALADSHWVGGDPGQGEAYGFAAWSPAAATLMLRNPSDKAQTFVLDIGAAFELPDGQPSAWELKRPWKEDADKPALKMQAGTTASIPLEPFEVIVWSASPLAGSTPYRYTGYEAGPSAAAAAVGMNAPREQFIGAWEYNYQGKTYRREFRADGSAALSINGQPYSGWKGFRWNWEGGHIFILHPDGAVDGEHALKDNDTLLFLTNPYGPAKRMKSAQPWQRYSELRSHDLLQILIAKFFVDVCFQCGGFVPLLDYRFSGLRKRRPTLK
ncbi:MAG: enterotoxin [Candidatus Sumerlaeota bacterium]|nr:enterotoxin [Candidatus Sumerlaeota bacterium]